jgi:hypothetical protein
VSTLYQFEIQTSAGLCKCKIEELQYNWDYALVVEMEGDLFEMVKAIGKDWKLVNDWGDTLYQSKLPEDGKQQIDRMLLRIGKIRAFL